MHPILSKGPFIYYVITFRGRGVWEMLILVLKLSRIKINLAYGKGGGRVQKATKYAYVILEWSLRDHSSIKSSKRWVGGVRKWQLLMIYNTVNHQRSRWVGLKKSKT